MAAYLQRAKDLLKSFSSYTIHQVPRSQNAKAYALARLASTKDAELLEVIHVEFLSRPSIHPTYQPQVVNCATMANSWMTPMIQYLKDGILPKNKNKARLLKLKAPRYIIYDEKLYKRGFSTPLLKCVDLEEGNYILQEIHEGICGNHAGGKSLAHKALDRVIFGRP